LGTPEVVVLNTKVLISATGWNGAERGLLGICRHGLLQLCISPDLLDELKRVMSYPKLGFDQTRAEHFISQILQHAVVVASDSRLSVITQGDTDNRVLECALASNASWIVSGDNHLLSPGSFADIPIMTTIDMLVQIDA
jgi:uncharacterized protein